MGIPCSKERVDSGAVPNRLPADFSPLGQSRENSSSYPGPSTDGIKLAFSKGNKPQNADESPPEYSDQPVSVAGILNVLQQAAKDGAVLGIVDAFQSIRHRHVQVWVDDNPRLKRPTRESIRLMAILLLALGKAHNSSMEIFFASQTNRGSLNLSREKREKSDALDDLFNTQNWDDAVQLVRETPLLQQLGVQQWIENSQTNAPQQTFRPNSSSMQKDTKVTSCETDAEKHTRLLSHVRQLKTMFWQGWHQRDIEPEKLLGLYTSALAESNKQPKLLNSICFTIERALELHTRLKGQDGAQPTTVLLLTGSPMVKSEETAIKALQDKVQGGGSEFSIATLVFDRFLDHKSRKVYTELDDHCEGDKDICDTTFVDEESFRMNGPGAKLLLKLLNSHVRAVDRLKFKAEAEKYGPMLLIAAGRTLTIPSVENIQERLGLDDNF